jgi:hypothetical protein
VQRRIVDDERVRCCCSSLLEQSDRITQQRERFRIFDDTHSMKILLYLRSQFFLRVLISQRDRDDDDDDVHLLFNFQALLNTFNVFKHFQQHNEHEDN